MRIKSYLLAGVMAFGLAAGCLYHHSAYATDAGPHGSYTVLAQNGDKGGFFSRIFNRDDDNAKAKAKPLFFDGDRGRSSGVQPYDFRQSRQDRESRRRMRAYDAEWEAFVQQREARQRQNAEQSMAASQASNRRYAALVEQKMAKLMSGISDSPDSPGISGENQKSSSKRRVYDPQKAWSYNPNDKAEKRTRPRLYNTQN